MQKKLFYFRFLPLLMLTLFTSPLVAESTAKSKKTLLFHGIYAAGFGDLLTDYSKYEGIPYLSLRLQAGFQVLRWNEVSVSLGYAKSGFYDGIFHLKVDEAKPRFDYRGPTAQVVIFPSRTVNLTIGGLFAGTGNIFRKYPSLPAEFSGLGIPPRDREYHLKSKAKVNELSAAFGIRLADQVQLLIGGGQRNLLVSDHSLSYQACQVANSKDKCRQVVNNLSYRPTESKSDTFFFIGLRGSQL